MFAAKRPSAGQLPRLFCGRRKFKGTYAVAKCNYVRSQPNALGCQVGDLFHLPSFDDQPKTSSVTMAINLLGETGTIYLAYVSSILITQQFVDSLVCPPKDALSGLPFVARCSLDVMRIIFNQLEDADFFSLRLTCRTILKSSCCSDQRARVHLLASRKWDRYKTAFLK